MEKNNVRVLSFTGWGGRGAGYIGLSINWIAYNPYFKNFPDDKLSKSNKTKLHRYPH